MRDLWLIEPKNKDDNWASTVEHTLDWLQRSTLPRAKQMRHFLNYNLSKLPQSMARVLKKQLRVSWSSAFFELIIGRLLQVTGFEFDYERANTDGNKPDFLVYTSYGYVVIEATVPKINSKVGEFYKMKNPLIEIIKEETPSNWIVLIDKLPEIGLSDSKRNFRKVVRSGFKELPSFDSKGDPIVIEQKLPQGRLKLDMLYNPDRINPIGIYPATSYAENSKYRIERAIHKKRSQLKNVAHPVILAIQGSFTGTDYGDFDQVLFGTTYEQMNLARQVVEKGFDANGLFISGNPDPTYQGVLAIPHVGFKGISNPVLYFHQRASTGLKESFRCFDNKFYNDKENKIVELEQVNRQYLKQLQFVTI